MSAAHNKKKKSYLWRFPAELGGYSTKKGVAFFVFSGFLPCSRGEEKLKGPQSRASFQPNEHFPAESSFLPRSSSVHMLIVRMCIEAADLQQPRLIPCQLIIARVTDSIKRWHFCSAASLSLSLSLFFFWSSNDENLFWVSAARGSWKLLLCLLLSACKNNSRLIYSSSLESWPSLRTHSVLFFFPRCQIR